MLCSLADLPEEIWGNVAAGFHSMLVDPIVWHRLREWQFSVDEFIRLRARSVLKDLESKLQTCPPRNRFPDWQHWVVQYVSFRLDWLEPERTQLYELFAEGRSSVGRQGEKYLRILDSFGYSNPGTLTCPIVAKAGQKLLRRLGLDRHLHLASTDPQIAEWLGLPRGSVHAIRAASTGAAQHEENTHVQTRPARSDDGPGTESTDQTYAQAFEAMRRARGHAGTQMLHMVRPEPGYAIDEITQMKLVTITGAMCAVGALPGDFPRSQFQRAIRYRRLRERSLEWLEDWGIPARREFAPLAAQDYRQVFGASDRLPVSDEDAGKFFGRLIHCLLIETQILLARQYYHGLGLYQPEVPFSLLSKAVPADIARGLKQASPNSIELEQLHGRIFLEYCAVMIRAQWDKLTRLVCLVLGLSLSWDSISKGLEILEQRLADASELHPWCLWHLRTFTKIAGERLAEDGWLKEFRDPLLHDVGKHSAGIVPQVKSLETTTEMWDKVCDEHDWLREAMMAMLAAFTSYDKAPEAVE